jgi:ATP-dependent DNA helicase RecG
VIKEIRTDMGTNAQNESFIAGRCRFWKKRLRFYESMLLALDNGFQACLMAPTN